MFLYYGFPRNVPCRPNSAFVFLVANHCEYNIWLGESAVPGGGAYINGVPGKGELDPRSPAEEGLPGDNLNKSEESGEVTVDDEEPGTEDSLELAAADKGVGRIRSGGGGGGLSK